ncbi:carbohydrate ABC transporter permease [Paenibacillus roseipurpureus]|uniref:Carbohydrate ABC transporter permease n=1 Tax=Paenibacillus roseopurpureus TaxID=2918901 RepID=A0AA96LN52_9BACL|nr:carbohydrate ABC transporter permease [Paenibacillus sp. MBLB1832]WNR42894.1 carbohydrate ABC transporter permease [Paenibacillus sp. MBLB1832]
MLPLVLIISGSFSNEEAILSKGYSLLPRQFDTRAYKFIFMNASQLFSSYRVTIFTTLTGTLLGLFITAMTAYVLSRRDFEWRNKFALYFFFTTLFSGGIVPWYILCVQYLHLNDTFAGLVVPMLLNVFNIIIMKSFMSEIPDAITESAKIDGAGDFLIFRTLILPLSKPVLATIGFFIALAYWNDWFLSYIFMQNEKYFTLQFTLYRVLSIAQALKNTSTSVVTGQSVLPSETLKLAMTVVATGPILLVYPFLQKYFIRGLTIGAVKG